MKVLPPLMVNPPSLLIAPLLQDAAPFYLMRCMEFKLLLLSGDIGVANFQLTGNTLIDGFQQISNLCVPSNVLITIANFHLWRPTSNMVSKII